MMKRFLFWFNTRRLVVAILFVALFAIAVRAPADTDTWWHLAAGRVTLQSGHVLQTDLFSHTRQGTAWVNHSWFSQVMLYWLFEHFSYAGLAAWIGAVVVAAFALVYLQMEGDLFTRAFIIVLAAVVWPLAGLLVALRVGGRLWAALFAGFVLVLPLIDLCVVEFTLYRVRPADEVLAEGKAAAAWLAEQPDRFRVHSPSYSIAHHTGAIHSIESAGGVDPFHLADYAAFMRDATGVDLSGYSVTVPSFPEIPRGEDMLLAHHDVVPDLELLGLLNARYLAAACPMEVDGLTPLNQWGEVYLYRNEEALPRAFVEEDYGRVREARVAEWTPNRIQVEAEGPGLLVLSEVYDPDWRVEMDGEAAEMMRVEGILRGVRLREGVHRVTFAYWPKGLTAGLILTGTGWLCAAALWIWPYSLGRKAAVSHGMHDEWVRG
jgi:hypothetical protein